MWAEKGWFLLCDSGRVTSSEDTRHPSWGVVSFGMGYDALSLNFR